MNKHLLIYVLLFLVILLCASAVSATKVSLGPGGTILAEEETWGLCYGYSLSVMAINALDSPKTVWLVFSKDNVQLDEEVVPEGGTYTYEEIFSTKISTIFAGMDSTVVRLNDTNISSNSLFVDKKTLIEGKTWDVCGGYSISLMLVDLETSPKKAWLILSKDGSQVDDGIIDEGEIYEYDDIFSTKVDTIFVGMTSNVAVLKDTYLSPDVAGDPEFCTEDWYCTDWSSWSECIDNLQSRTKTCTESSACGTTVFKPAESEFQSCESEICTEDWYCTDWGTCISGEQVRDCTDLSSCGTENNKPSLMQSCVESCTEEWTCDDWSICVSETQSRTCKDLADCGTETNKPIETQDCVSCTEEWECDEWSICENGRQSRTCTDLSSCGTGTNKPLLFQKCETESIDSTNKDTENQKPQGEFPIFGFEIIALLVVIIVGFVLAFFLVKKYTANKP
ncbi:MAG: S-layer protein domain-containing protein [Candidatus Diapherotrites archaeon]